MLDLNSKSIPDFAKLARKCKSPEQANAVHRQVIQSDFANERFICNLIVEMYGRLGCLDSAKHVFDTINQPNTFTWNILVAAYARAGHIVQSKEILDIIPQPNSVSYTTVLAAISKYGSLLQCEEFFDTIPEKDIFTWNVLLAAYARKGCLGLVTETFERMPVVDVVSCTTMIQILVDNNELDRALDLFNSIPARDVVIYNIVMQACVKDGRGKTAQGIFDSMPETSLASWNIILGAWDTNSIEAKSIFDQMPERAILSWNALLTSYVQCNKIDQARQTFEILMPERDVVSWTILIARYAQLGHIKLAEAMFASMPIHDVYVYDSMLAGYCQLEILDIDRAENFFSSMPMHGILSSNTLLGGYARGGYIAKAKKLFDEMPEKDMVSYNSLFLASFESKDGVLIDETMVFFFETFPYHDFVSWNTVISGYAQAGNLQKAKDSFDRMPYRNNVSYNAMMSAYGNLGELEETIVFFDAMPVWSSQSWTVVMNAYTRSGRGGEAIDFFRDLCARGVLPDELNFVTALEACARAMDIVKGLEVYCKFVSSGQAWSSEVSCALIDLFRGHGRCELSQKIFQRVFSRNLELWTAMIQTFAHCGRNSLAVEALSDLYLDGLEPDQTVLATVLSVCSQAGQVLRGMQLFARMFDDGEVPESISYHCMIDLLARSGRLDDAEKLIKDVPGEIGIGALSALLNGCGLHGEIDRSTGKLENVFNQREHFGGIFVLLANSR